MEFLDDFRYAFGRHWKDRAFTSVVVLALAMGIGTNTVFTLVNAVLFKGLPFEDPDRILNMNSRNLKESNNFQCLPARLSQLEGASEGVHPLAAPRFCIILFKIATLASPIF